MKGLRLSFSPASPGKLVVHIVIAAEPVFLRLGLYVKGLFWWHRPVVVRDFFDSDAWFFKVPRWRPQSVAHIFPPVLHRLFGQILCKAHKAELADGLPVDSPIRPEFAEHFRLAGIMVENDVVVQTLVSVPAFGGVQIFVRPAEGFAALAQLAVKKLHPLLRAIGIRRLVRLVIGERQQPV